MEDEPPPMLDEELLQFPHIFLAIGTTLGFLILTVETYYPGAEMSKLRRGGKSLAALLLALLAAGLTAVLSMYWGGYLDRTTGVHTTFIQTINNLKLHEGEN